jgi:hypothetical protein
MTIASRGCGRVRDFRDSPGMCAEPVTLGGADLSPAPLRVRDAALLLLAAAPLFVGLGIGLHGSEARAVAVPLAVASADVLLCGQVAAFARRWRALGVGALLGAALYLAPFAASRLECGD